MSTMQVGDGRSPVIVVDGLCRDIDAIKALAVARAPFGKAEQGFYPGSRHLIGLDDGDAARYAQQIVGVMVAIAGNIFRLDNLVVHGASFSMITQPPETLSVQQSAPHYDTFQPGVIAGVHYISGLGGSGTAFYRQRSTGIERVTERNRPMFQEALSRDGTGRSGYIDESNAAFDRIGFVEGVPGRLAIYPGCLLHSGIVPRGVRLSDDPETGRLTGNFFIEGKPASNN